MLTITSEEFINNIDKYIKLGYTEELEIIEKDKVLFYITPKGKKLENQSSHSSK